MDRKKTIQVFEDMKRGLYPLYPDEYLDTAIEALSSEPCEDAISRQAAIGCLTATGLKQFDFILDARYKIKNLPPVTPQPKMGHWVKEEKHHKDDFQEFDYWDVRCSECGARKRIGWTNIRHCPMCGVKMEPYEAESED